MSVTKAPRPCMRDCGRAAQRGKRKCGWCALSEKPIAEQLDAARWRRQQAERRPGYVFAARVKPDLWPPGYRWCSDCQMMIPLDQCRGSKCLAHSSSSAHESRMSRTYSLPPGEYERLLQFQRGRCYICGKVPRSRRLAVDHDHTCCPGEISCGRCVRGLLCSDNERGCNHVVVGNLEGAMGGFTAAAKRIWDYANDPPYEQMKRALLEGGPLLDDPPF